MIVAGPKSGNQYRGMVLNEFISQAPEAAGAGSDCGPAGERDIEGPRWRKAWWQRGRRLGGRVA